MYVYGTQFWLLIISETFTNVVMATIYIPVFYKLQITSSYEYLRKRFSNTVRTLGSALFILKMVIFRQQSFYHRLTKLKYPLFQMLYIPVVIYVPALAFAQVTGFSLKILIPSVCLVCIFYTSFVSYRNNFLKIYRNF